MTGCSPTECCNICNNRIFNFSFKDIVIVKCVCVNDSGFSSLPADNYDLTFCVVELKVKHNHQFLNLLFSRCCIKNIFASAVTHSSCFVLGVFCMYCEISSLATGLWFESGFLLKHSDKIPTVARSPQNIRSEPRSTSRPFLILTLQRPANKHIEKKQINGFYFFNLHLIQGGLVKEDTTFKKYNFNLNNMSEEVCAVTVHNKDRIETDLCHQLT